MHLLDPGTVDVQVCLGARHVGDQRVAHWRQGIGELQQLRNLRNQPGDNCVRLDGFGRDAIDHGAHVAQRKTDVAQPHIGVVRRRRQLHQDDADFITRRFLTFLAQVDRHLNCDRSLEFYALIAEVPAQCTIEAGQRNVIDRRAGTLANPVDAFHRHARCRKLAPRCHLPRQRCFGDGDKRQRDGILGEFDAFEKQHGRKTTNAEQASAGTANFFPRRLHLLLVAHFGSAAMTPMFKRPDGPECQIIGRFRHAFRNPACHGDAIGIGVMHFLIERKTTIAQAVDHVYFPQRTGAIKHRRVQGRDKIVQRLPIIAPTTLAELVIKNMLRKVNRVNVLPVRHGAG